MQYAALFIDGFEWFPETKYTVIHFQASAEGHQCNSHIYLVFWLLVCSNVFANYMMLQQQCGEVVGIFYS